MKNSITAVALLLLICSVAGPLHAAGAPAVIEITPARIRAQPGDRVEFTLRGAGATPEVVLLTSGQGIRRLTPAAAEHGHHTVGLVLPASEAPGLYLVHAWTGEADRPRAVGKAVILAGPIVLDFFLPAYLDKSDPRGDLARYLDDFMALGGNTLIAHALVTPARAYFPSAIARGGTDPGDDRVGQLLQEADRRGVAVLLSVSWDMTREAPYRDRMPQIAALMEEMHARYAAHPSMAGFYSYQEGSGTYYVPYVREFTGRVKRLNPGLLSACAPFVDDPLLAGYLSTVDTLDMMIFQGQVMASYRTDNRKRYPIRRVRDFAALGIGAKWLQDKIAITHVELFGYLEHRPDPAVLAASYDNIFGQIASVATAPGADGIALFAYHPHIWAGRKQPRVQESRRAVADGLDLFRRVHRNFAGHFNPLAVYFPYSDWIVERWTTSFLPALDGFRQAGIPVDILPYAPRLDEAEYPYFPIHLNPAVLERLLARRRVLVLPDVSGFQQTDSDLIDAFVRRGGVIVAFGPQIPMGRSFDRDRLFGGRELDATPGAAAGGRLLVPEAFASRTAAASTCSIPPLPGQAWTATSARVLASFTDGTAAVLANRHGSGLAISILPSAADLAGSCAALMRDVLEYALGHVSAAPLADVDGLSAASDVAISPAASGLAITVVNHEPVARTVEVRALEAGGDWRDALSGRSLETGGDGRLRLEVPAHGARVLELSRERAKRP